MVPLSIRRSNSESLPFLSGYLRVEGREALTVASWLICRLEKGPEALYPRPASFQVAKGSPVPDNGGEGV